MKNKILMWLLAQLMGMLNPTVLKELVDRILDFVEDQIADSETELDDQLALPLIAMIREAFGIPDDD